MTSSTPTGPAGSPKLIVPSMSKLTTTRSGPVSTEVRLPGGANRTAADELAPRCGDPCRAEDEEHGLEDRPEAQVSVRERGRHDDEREDTRQWQHRRACAHEHDGAPDRGDDQQVVRKEPREREPVGASLLGAEAHFLERPEHTEGPSDARGDD